MKHFNIVVINGEEKEISSLSKEERQRLVDEWNRRALDHLGYKRDKTAYAVESRTSLRKRK